MTGRFFTQIMVETFIFIRIAIFKTLCKLAVLRINGSWRSILINDPFNPGPTSNDSCPSNNWIYNNGVWLNDNIFSHDAIDESSAFTYLCHGSNCNIWADFSRGIYLSWRVDTHDTFDLTLCHLYWLGQYRLLNCLIIFQVSFLRRKILLRVRDLLPEVILLIKHVQVSLLSSTQEIEYISHVYLWQ